MDAVRLAWRSLAAAIWSLRLARPPSAGGHGDRKEADEHERDERRAGHTLPTPTRIHARHVLTKHSSCCRNAAPRARGSTDIHGFGRRPCYSCRMAPQAAPATGPRGVRRHQRDPEVGPTGVTSPVSRMCKPTNAPVADGVHGQVGYHHPSDGATGHRGPPTPRSTDTSLRALPSVPRPHRAARRVCRPLPVRREPRRGHGRGGRRTPLTRAHRRSRDCCSEPG